jgi:phosphomannomutase
VNPDIFRAYDIRGKFGADFSPEDFYFIAQAYAKVVQPKVVAVGHDVRETSGCLWQQIVSGLTDAGVDVLNIGGISTDMLYFAVVNYRTDGGVVVSASHNPREYNGLKMVREQAIPISRDSGIMTIRDEALKMSKLGRKPVGKRGVVRTVSLMDDYVQHMRYFTDLGELTPKHLLLNANCGFAGQAVSRILEGTPITYDSIFFEPDGTFASVPRGRPDPMQPDNQAITTGKFKNADYAFATAWDADADRCFFFDEKGDFVDGPYVTARLGESLVRENHGGSVICDPRVIWPVEAAVNAVGGTTIIGRCGHSFIKELMRKTDSIFGGETSAHYYFRRYYYTDNGMIPFLLTLRELCRSGRTLSEWLGDLRTQHPLSGEINYAFPDTEAMHRATAALHGTEKELGDGEIEPEMDGLSIRFKNPTWRFNVRKSNTEPFMRLNVEGIGDAAVVQTNTETLGKILEDEGGQRQTPFRWE